MASVTVGLERWLKNHSLHGLVRHAVGKTTCFKMTTIAGTAVSGYFEQVSL